MTDNPEFQVGDIVHYRGSHDHPVAGYPVKVREIYVGRFAVREVFVNGAYEPDDRIFYSLRGDRDYSTHATRTATANVIVESTGRCIIESSLYIPPSERD